MIYPLVFILILFDILKYFLSIKLLIKSDKSHILFNKFICLSMN